MTQLVTVDRATLEQVLTELQRMSNACELEGDKHGDGNKWHRLSDDATKAIAKGRAALANAEQQKAHEREACEVACRKLETAIDGGGNVYYRPADARQCVAAIRERGTEK